MDLISREQALMLSREAYFPCDGGAYIEHYINANDIRNLPSIDAVKHGRWIAQKGGGYCCSECGCYSLDEVDGAFVHVSARTRYCHNCGARMDGEKNE